MAEAPAWARSLVLAVCAEADAPLPNLTWRHRDRPTSSGVTRQSGGMRLAPDPIRLDGESPPLRGAPPLLGEHTDELLTELGIGPEKVARLRRDGVVA